jgi:hypothetical protein
MSNEKQSTNLSVTLRDDHDLNNPYVKISAKLAKDKNLTVAAKGIMLEILSNSDNFIFHKKNFYNKGTGRVVINNSFDILEEEGYLTKGSYGKYHFWVINENPSKINTSAYLQDYAIKIMTSRLCTQDIAIKIMTSLNCNVIINKENNDQLNNDQLNKKEENKKKENNPDFSENFEKNDFETDDIGNSDFLKKDKKENNSTSNDNDLNNSTSNDNDLNNSTSNDNDLNNSTSSSSFEDYFPKIFHSDKYTYFQYYYKKVKDKFDLYITPKEFEKIILITLDQISDIDLNNLDDLNSFLKAYPNYYFLDKEDLLEIIDLTKDPQNKSYINQTLDKFNFYNTTPTICY